jgi:hypothetical protein
MLDLSKLEESKELTGEELVSTEAEYQDSIQQLLNSCGPGDPCFLDECPKCKYFNEAARNATSKDS